MTTNNETTLIAKIIDGDTKAFAEVVESHKNLVFSLALRLLGNQEEAEEASQDTFIKVYRSLQRFKGDSKFSTWIYRIAYNTCLDRLKSNKRRQLHQQIELVQEKQLLATQDAWDGLEQKERAEMIQSCLKKLPSEDAALLTFFYFEEMTLKDIEKIMNLSGNTLKVRLHRARKKMAAVLLQNVEPEIRKSYG